jgi:hypothetical protein
LPPFAIHFRLTWNAEATHRDAAITEVDPMDPQRMGSAGYEFSDLKARDIPESREQQPEVGGLTPADVEARVCGFQKPE